MDTSSAKQQIVEKIKDSSNILVTVSESPSVDELSAALGLTAMLNKMNKHATAVFSGAIPPAIQFLEPDKTFENTVDSLRDFIIALNKEKADHLRYKVDGDVVKIFITPYRTTIDDSDLEFSQGDYNVELVLALGVKTQENLDKALEAHGRIFHDATVATLSAGSDTSNLGSIDWNEHSASSLSEMLVGLSDTLRSDKTLLDERVATALLTGIVATTDRFSNNLTSSKVMTIAAQLMSAGANQQLIAAKLEEAHEIGENKVDKSQDQNQNSDGSTDLSEGESSKVQRDETTPKKKRSKQKAAKTNDGELSISHEMKGDVDAVAEQTASENQEEAAAAAEQAEAELERQTQAPSPDEAKPEPANPEQELAEHLAEVTNAPSSTPSVADLQKDIASAASDVDAAATGVDKEATPEPTQSTEPEPDEPSLGGTLNATTEDAAEEKRREERNDRNHTILSHQGSYMGATRPTYDTPLNATVDPMSDAQPPAVDPMSEPSSPTVQSPTVTPPTKGMTLAEIDSANRSPHEQARDDIAAAYSAQDTPATEASSAAPITPPPMPPMPDFSTLPPLPSLPGQENVANPQPEPAPEATPAPSITAPPANPFVAPSSIDAPAPAPQEQPLAPSDPGQFKIPGS